MGKDVKNELVDVVDEDITDNLDDGLDIDGEGDGQGSDDEKTFTQDDVDKMVKDRLARERKKWERTLEAKVESKLKEKQRLSELSDEELANERLKQREKELEERERAIQHRELMTETEHVLRERGLPSTFAGFLISEDNDTTLNNVIEFQKAFNQAVKEAVKKELSGRTPDSFNNTNKVLTRAEIAKIDDPVKRRRLLAELNI